MFPITLLIAVAAVGTVPSADSPVAPFKESPGPGRVPETTYVADIGEARRICDSVPLMPAEGIWEFPADHVTVLAIREKPEPGPLPRLALIAVESEDTRILPGDTIGFLDAGTKPETYSLTLMTSQRKGIFGKPMECTVRFDPKTETMTIPASKKPFRFRISINPSSLLPGFLKIVRGSVSASQSSESETCGMVRVYPSYDGNGSMRSKPRYL